MYNPRSRFLRDPSKKRRDTSRRSGTGRATSHTDQYERLQRLPDADVQFEEWQHVRRMKDRLCDHLGLSWRPKIRLVPAEGLEQVMGRGTKGVCTQTRSDLSADIFLGAPAPLHDLLESCAHELLHAAQIRRKGVGSLDAEDEAEAERLGCEAAREYLRQAREVGAL